MTLRRVSVLIVALALLGALAVAVGPVIWDRAIAPAGIMFESSVDLSGQQAEAMRAYAESGGSDDLVPLTREQYRSAANELDTASSLAPGEVPFFVPDEDTPRVITLQKNPDGSWGFGVSVSAEDWRP
jgi:hypothetical protein